MRALPLPGFLFRRHPTPRLEGWRLCGTPRRLISSLCVDNRYMLQGSVVLTACLPLRPQPRVHMQSGSASLLLGAAVTAMADTTPDREPLLALARSLRFNPEKFHTACPVLEETSLGGVPGRILRDGSARRAYYLGDPAALFAQCSMIWDGGPRPVTPADRDGFVALDGRQYGLATASIGPKGQEEPVYLGSLLVAEAVNRDMEQDMRALQEEGMAVSLRYPGDGPCAGNAVLHVTGDPLEALRLAPDSSEPAGLYRAVTTLSAHLMHLQDLLVFALLGTLTAACCALLCASPWWMLLLAPLCGFALLMSNVLRPRHYRAQKLAAAALTCAVCGLCGGFLTALGLEGGGAIPAFLSLALCILALVPRRFSLAALLLAGVLAAGLMLLLAPARALAGSFALISGFLGGLALILAGCDR